MTRVFVYEYTCATATPGSAASLTAEGRAMLAALLADFQAIPGCTPLTIGPTDHEERAFRQAVGEADWCVVIAPEFQNLLATRCRWVLQEGGRLLGPTPGAVELCADKLALARWWTARQTPTPETCEHDTSAIPAGWLTKLRYGAGSIDMNRDSSHLGPMIRQRRVQGVSVSQVFLIGPDAVVPLTPANQHIDDGTLAYRGGRVPLAQPLADRARALARKAIEGIDGLFGYVGVDMILGDAGGDWAIEINPRLTTSYVGLRSLCESNLAGVMLDLAEGRQPPMLRWRDQVVDFTPSGGITILSRAS